MKSNDEDVHLKYQKDIISYYDTIQQIFVVESLPHWLLHHGVPAKPKKITKSQYEMLAALRYSLRKFMHFSEEAAKGEGLTPQQHQALLAIKGFPDRDCITIQELAERLQILHHSAVGLADRLVREKYISRMRGEDDRRKVFIALTPRGESLLEKLSAAHHEQLRRIGPEINSLLNRLQGID